MKVLIVGSGGREHALAWKATQSPKVTEVFVAPGNAGTEQLGTNVAISATDASGLVRFAAAQSIDLTIIGPDDALAAGLVDQLQAAGLRAFGPKQHAARLESSKGFAKRFMTRHRIPTAPFRTCSTSEEARRALGDFGLPVVIKADGLALGKGVLVAHDRAEALQAIVDTMEAHRFGEAGNTVVIEEFLSGFECSIHALVDGASYLLFPTAQDHKQLYDGSLGPNTGGMGTFSPSARIDETLLQRIETEILRPLLQGIREEGIDFRGLLFPGLMITADGPKVLEFNCRFGDPETQSILPRLESDLIDLLEATIDGRLAEARPVWDTRTALCVIMASRGYPGSYEKGKTIQGIEAAEQDPAIRVFQAGTRREKEKVVTSGGRVLGVTALAPDLPAARQAAYEAVAKIEFEGSYFRRDIGSI
jgi:phosphoribosylamine---glycine ligase